MVSGIQGDWVSGGRVSSPQDWRLLRRSVRILLECFLVSTFKKKRGGQDIVVPNVREISHFDGHVDVDGPEIRSLRVAAQDVLEHRLPPLRFSHLVLQLRKLTQNLYI